MKYIIVLGMLAMLIISGCTSKETSDNTLTDGQEYVLDKSVLQDKIMGAWAGQVIGCTFGGPTEFKFKGTMIPDNQFIPWYKGVFKWWYEKAPGLYDDIYMDLTFVDVFEKEGLDAPVESFANAFAHAGYMLWHANQAARYNILQGIMPPASGNWKNNPHADDIDFQIEADFAGIMSPGMINTASTISDKIGHIMNYGDGWYGGVYVAAMYALSFLSDDIQFIVEEGLKAIPSQSGFYHLMSDVIAWYNEYPDDWKMNWFLTQKKWASEVGCPDGVFDAFNIDAKINAAYIIIGLLYGEGDFGKTIKISTLCGQDSDCNPASAGGILGSILGYSNIPEEWKNDLKEVEDLNFKYTDISLNKAYEYSFNQAIKNIKNNGGTETSNQVIIKFQEAKPVKLEQAFAGHYPKEFKNLQHSFTLNQSDIQFNFEGNGFVIKGGCQRGADEDYIGVMDVFIDGKLYESAKIPGDFKIRRLELVWAYDLNEGKHNVKIHLKNPEATSKIEMNRILVYSDIKQVSSTPTIEIID